MNPLGNVKIKWSPEFAYAIGLLTTDGNLSPDGRHINFTSKDFKLAVLFKKCLDLSNIIGEKARGGEKEKKYYVVQFGDILFYNFLLSIGMMPKKSKVLEEIKIPAKYFFDFLRGHFDGDGSFYSYWDPRWRASFMFYTIFVSASKKHIVWIQNEIFKRLKITGHITKAKKSSIYQLKYAKRESLKLIPKLYYDKQVPFLTRKHVKIQAVLKDRTKMRGW